MAPPDAPNRTEGLLNQVNGGLRWAMVRQVLTTFTSTAAAIVLLNFIAPDEVGEFGIALLVFGGLVILIQFPFRDAVVYFQQEDEEAATSSAAFWLLASITVIAIAAVMAGAGLLAEAYNAPQAAPLTRGLAVAFLGQALAVVPAALLLKRMQFAAHQSIYIGFELIISAGRAGLALAGFGPWALVIPEIIGGAFLAGAMWWRAGFRPVRHPGASAFRKVFRYSRSLLGSKFLLYLRLNLDNIAVGTLGTLQLGWYRFGEEESASAGIAVARPVAAIALPAMAAVQSSLPDLRHIYLRMLRLTSSLTTPMQMGALIIADLVILTIFGEEWAGAIAVFQAYLVFRLIDALLEITDSAVSAAGRPEIRFRVDLAQMPFFALGVWLGLPYGILGIAVALSVIRTLAGLIYLGISFWITGARVREVVSCLLPSFAASAMMALAVWAARTTGVLQGWAAAVFASPRLADVLVISGLVVVGVAVYGAVLLLIDRHGTLSVLRTAWQIAAPDGLQARVARWPLAARLLEEPPPSV